MKTAVVGAGVIGCMFGDLLTGAGAEVRRVDVWPHHVGAIAEHGPSTDTSGATIPARARATTCPDRLGRADLINVLPESTDTHAVVEVIRATSKKHTSMSQHVDHKRWAGIGSIDRAVVSAVTKLGLEVPINQTPTALIEIPPADY